MSIRNNTYLCGISSKFSACLAMFSFNLEEISKYRQQIMGIATIAILICHAPANISQIPSTIGKILGLGGVFGNTIFFFLSGLGMFYSIDSKDNIDWRKWYTKRYSRILIPFFIISFPIMLYYVIIGKHSISNAIAYLSTMSYWISHKGAWFLNALALYYLFTPIIKKIFDRKFSFIYFVLLSLFIYTLNIFESVEYSPLDNIQQVTSHCPCYLLGLWSAKYIKQGKVVNMLHVLGFIILVLCVRFIFKLNWIHLTIFVVVPSVLIAFFVVKLFARAITLLSIFGKISLESYLLNTGLPGIFKTITPIASGQYDILRYLIVLIIGLGLSFPLQKLSSFLTMKISK